MSCFASGTQVAHQHRAGFPLGRRIHLISLASAIAFVVPFLFGAAPAAAQAPIKLATLHVSLWPEYDQPSMLVILDGQIDPSVTLPASLTIRIPSRVAKPSAVATAGTNGQLLTLAFTTSTAGDSTLVQFNTSAAGFRVEYYDPGLTISGQARDFTFQWASDYPIGDAVVRVQQPFNAHDLKGTPALTSAGVADFGLSYFDLPVGPMTAGQGLSLQLSYQKPDSVLSVTTVPTQPASAAQSTAAPATAASPAAGQARTLPFIIGGAVLGLALIGGGVVWYLRSARPAPVVRHARRTRHQAPRRQPAARAVRPAAAAQAPAIARFCTHCGQPLLSGDRFCRKCGHPVPSA